MWSNMDSALIVRVGANNGGLGSVNNPGRECKGMLHQNVCVCVSLIINPLQLVDPLLLVWVVRHSETGTSGGFRWTTCQHGPGLLW